MKLDPELEREIEILAANKVKLYENLIMFVITVSLFPLASAIGGYGHRRRFAGLVQVIGMTLAGGVCFLIVPPVKRMMVRRVIRSEAAKLQANEHLTDVVAGEESKQR